MSKRLVRIASGKLSPMLDQLKTLEINAVLQNGNTLFGKLVSFTADHIVVEDFRSHSHNLRIADIYEIVYDKVQPKKI